MDMETLEVLQIIAADIKDLKIGQEKLIRDFKEINERIDNVEEKIDRTLTGVKKLTSYYIGEKI
ncbi:MAG: hypothetical protein SPE00_00385 [Bacilli bacterium]|nr:hypothetical protein [Bacilli bacterium]